MVASAGPSLIELHLIFMKGTVTQMDEDMGDSPETPECRWSKVDIECLIRMQTSVVVLPLLESPHSRGDTVMQRRKLFPKEKRPQCRA